MQVILTYTVLSGLLSWPVNMLEPVEKHSLLPSCRI